MRKKESKNIPMKRGVFTWVLFLLFLMPLYSAPQDRTREESFSAMIEETMERKSLPGMTLSVIQEGRPIYSYNANIEPNSRIHIASLTKSFTALAIMQLVEGGTLSLAQDFREYLPWFDLRHHREAHISLRSLLNMSSGFPSSYGNRWTHTHKTLREEVESFQGIRLESHPEEQTKYNNVNYLILGAIIEEVTGMDFEAYLRENIITPLGMDNTDFSNRGIVEGHRSFFFWHVPTQVEYLNNHSSDAGLVSTQQDMNKYMAALLDPEIMENRGVLSRPFLEDFFTLVSPEPDGEGRYYAMGFWQYQIEGETAYEADCAYPRGFHGKMLLMPKAKLGAFYISNTITVISESFTGTLLENLLRTTLGLEILTPSPDHGLSLVSGFLILLILQQWLRSVLLLRGIYHGDSRHQKRKLLTGYILPSTVDLSLIFMGMLGFALLFQIGPWTMENMILDIYILLRLLSFSALLSLVLRVIVFRQERNISVHRQEK